MIASLLIKNFRGFREISLRELRRVNLLVGGNDTGKTSVLEALVLLLGDASLVSELPTIFRSSQSGDHPGNTADDRQNFWPWLFYDRDSSNQINISAETEDRRMLTVTSGFAAQASQSSALQTSTLARGIGGGSGQQELLRYDQQGVTVFGSATPSPFRVSRLSVRPSHPVLDAEKYNQIALESEGESRFEKIMREVEPRLKRLRYAKLPGTNSPLLFADVGLSRAVPSTQMGQAFNRILHIYAEILTSKTNLLLIDEIENGIFSESLKVIWKGLFTICAEYNVQVFATTHSRECVMAANAVASERGQDELSVQRLQIVKGTVEAVRLGVEHLEMAAEMGLEVRS
jgi:hypothetical protein